MKRSADVTPSEYERMSDCYWPELLLKKNVKLRDYEEDLIRN